MPALIARVRARGRRLAPLLLLLAVAAVAACSGYAGKVARLRTDLAAGNPAAALGALDKLYDADTRSLPYLMEKGMLQYLTEDYDGCQVSLAAADQVVDELYTRSLSREVGRLLLNDTVQEYRGERFEQVWIHYYRALAYLDAGQTHDAAVEGRAATQALTRHADTGDDAAKYRNDPFLQYVAGLLYEMDGELNDAWINYREAERLYRAVDIYGVPAPPRSLIEDLLDAGHRLGFDEEVASYREAYPDVEPRAVGPDEGELVILVDTGLAPGKVSERIDFPIYEDANGDEEAAWTVATHAYDTWHVEGRKQKLAYILSIALPAVPPSGPPPRLSGTAGGAAGTLDLGADLGALSRQCLEDRYGAVVIRTVARALLKYWAKKKMEEKHGEGAGFLTDILGSVTEVADTRSWSTLPAHVSVTRVALPAGEHRVELRGGRGVGDGQAVVDIVPGRLHFLALRLY